MFESDGWFDWEPDPHRAAGDADPSLQPYASMTRAEILALMAEAKGGREWEFLQEYFLNTCGPDELAVGTDAFIQTHYSDVFGFEEACYLEGAIELAIQRRLAPSGSSRTPAEKSAETPFSYSGPSEVSKAARASVEDPAA